MSDKENDIDKVEKEDLNTEQISEEISLPNRINIYIILGGICLVILIWISIVYFISNNKSIEKIDTSSGDYNSEQDINTSITDKECLQLIEDMTDQIVKANTKWGHTEMTPKNIELAISWVQSMENTNDRTYLEKELLKWRKGNFDNGVQIHNYVWNRLGGTIGEAKNLDKNKIKKIQQTYFNN